MTAIKKATLSDLLYGKVDYDPGSGKSKTGPLYGQTPEDVGLMVPDLANMDGISVSAGGKHIGVGVYVSKTLNLGPILGSKTVMAKAKAYIVNESGDSYTPSYWVKLGK